MDLTGDQFCHFLFRISNIIFPMPSSSSSFRLCYRRIKKNKLVVNIEECGANLKVRLSKRNGNNTYLEQNIQKLGKYEFDYTHEEGRDDDVRISFEIPKGQEGKDSVCITSV